MERNKTNAISLFLIVSYKFDHGWLSVVVAGPQMLGVEHVGAWVWTCLPIGQAMVLDDIQSGIGGNPREGRAVK